MLKRVKILFISIISIAFIFTLYAFMDLRNIQPQLAIFSWSTEEMNDYTGLLELLDEYGFNRIYQSFPKNISEQEIISFVLALSEREIDVYALSGTPEWALDSTGASMIEHLKRIVMINQQLPEKQKIKGMVVDVEPYLLKDFDWNDSAIQHSFVSGMKNLYQAAQREDLELIVVVPYFYDTKGYEKVLSTFIQESSSEVAVMNYYRDREIDHLSFEAKEAKKANKPLTTIYEFKAPGEHGLSERNTYYYEGVFAVQENTKELIKHFHHQVIHIAYHDYRAFREVIQHD